MLIYFIGCVIAFILAIIEYNNKKNTDDFSEREACGMIFAITFLSWISVALMFYCWYKENR